MSANDMSILVNSNSRIACHKTLLYGVSSDYYKTLYIKNCEYHNKTLLCRVS